MIKIIFVIILIILIFAILYKDRLSNFGSGPAIFVPHEGADEFIMPEHIEPVYRKITL